MKKKHLFIIPVILLLGIFTVHAQYRAYHPLVQEGKMWSEVKREGQMPWEWKYTTYQMSFFGETMINDIPYKKMYVSTKEYPIFPQDWTLQNFMREDEDKKVWYKSNASSAEKLYYDFSLEIGDILPDNLGYLCLPTVVRDITYERMHNGEERKVWHLLIDGYYEESWIEGMGSNLGVIFPISAGLVGYSYNVLCFHENEELIYADNAYDLWGCYKGSLNDINTFDAQIKIYPNPVKNVLHIKINENMNINSISLINIQGQIIRQYDSNIQQIDVSDITEGVYFIKVSSLKGNITKQITINK